MKTKAGLSLFTLLLCLSVNSCNKYANHVDEAPWDKKGPITKSFVDPGDTLSNGLSGYKAIRISITSLEQLAAIELDTSIVILHYCTPGDNDKPQPIKLSSSSRGEDVLVCDAETAPDIDLYPIDVYWPDGKNIPDTINYMSLNDSLLSDRDGSVRRPGLDPLPLQPAFINGQVRAYDNRLSEYVSVKNAKIKYYQKQGSNEVLQYTTTDSNGNFILDVPAVYRDVELVLQNSNFIIRNGNTSAVKSISLGAPAFYYFEPLKGAGEDGPRANILPTSMQRDLSSDFFLDVYNAAHYYFNGNNELLNQVTRYSSTSPLNIFAVNHKDEIDDNRGTFSYNQSGTQLPYVTIYNPEIENYTGAASKIFGTALHELGHAGHYYVEGATVFGNIDNIIVESFASFFGWLNVLHYYSSVAPNHADVNSICTQGRQSWQAVSDTLVYTPFYIDLYDNYNQSLHYSSPNVVNDEISNVPVSIILSLAFGHSTFSTVYSQLAWYIGEYFTLAEYNDFTTPYSIFL